MKFRLDLEREKLIVVDSTRTEYHQLKLHLTRYVKDYKYQPRFKLGVWDGTISHFNNGQINLGLWKECFDLCKTNNWKFEIENKEDFPINKTLTLEMVEEFCKEFFKNHQTKDDKPFMPYDHQIYSAYKILKNRYCITEVATGGGKSLIFGIIIFYILKNIKPNAKFLLACPNITLVSQFHDDLYDYLYGFNDEFKDRSDIQLHLEEIMSDKPRRSEHEANVFIGTVQSLEKRDKEWFNQFYGVCMDECLHPDSLVTKSDNTKIKISDIKIGDLVKTFNNETNKIETKPVDYVYKNLSKGNQLYEIELDNGETIKITGNHKVKLLSGEWKRVDELKNNDDIYYI